VLAIVHEDSLVRRLYGDNAKVVLCAFEKTPEEPACVAKIKQGLARVMRESPPAQGDVAGVAEHSARAMTHRLCRLFDSAIAPTN